MKLDQFLKTWEGGLIENAWNRIALIILSVIILALTILLFNKEQLVVLQPATLNADAWITKNKSSQSYKEAWGLFFAILTANITPGNISFIKVRMQPYLSPKIHNEVIDAFETQAQKITNDRITVRFEPRLVEYEEGTNKVFVTGYSFIKGAAGTERKTQRTYEYTINIGNYAPLLVDAKTYEGTPKTIKYLSSVKKVKE